MIAAAIILVIITIIFVGPIDVSTPKIENEFKNWNRSGPFAINKFEYKIGESVFMVVDGLTPNDVGNAVFVLPNGTTKYISIPFDGTQKPGFNKYFEPAVSSARHICSTDDLIGEWIVIFTNTEYQPLKFRVLNETLASEIGSFERVC